MAKTDILTPPGTGRHDSLTPEQKEFLKQMWAEYFQITDSGETNRSDGLLTPSSSTINSIGADDSSINSKVSTGKRSWFGSSKSSKSSNNNISNHKRLSDDLSSTHLSLAQIGLLSDQIRLAFWNNILGDHPDSLLLRFLRARKWNIANGTNMLLKAIKWRIEENIEEFEEKNEDGLDIKYRGLKKLMEMGGIYARGTDKQGRLVINIPVRLLKTSNQDPKSLEKFTLYITEMRRVLIQYPIETVCIVYDMTGFGIANMDYNFVKYTIRSFEAYYPESLGVMLFHKAPLVFWGVWKIIEPWLDPVVASKVRFTRSDKELTEYIDASHLPVKFGGLDKYTFEYIPPVPGENDRMSDIETKERLHDEWKAIMWKFEALTREWIACKTTEGARPEDVIEAERKQLAKELRVAYFKLDPYIRARTMYHRSEHPVIQADGTIFWRYIGGDSSGP
ncbi:hypothetical protein BGZ80_011244 [Entomortierella chlamydospora]|uniref:CRAL-TRIO domain-containing protein n=1 Tax=Entomortierella chlamydospora TaxID=101097 RepID=A0A9P6MUT1_9FUNG|nr:hypothetical protein BGZ80_011244 [Entomortierella chlamydospora]